MRASLRDPLGAEAAMAAGLKKYAYPADAEVVEVGTGGNTGKVKVRLPGELTPTADLPWAPVVGSVPAVSDRVLAFIEFASRRVITGGTGGSYTLPDASTTVKGGTKLSVAPVSPTSPIAVGDNDTRNTNARTPTAHKTSHEPGGTDALTALTDASIAAANKDGVAGTASMRTLGTSATSAAAGNRGLPSGGSSGQVLAKSSGTDYAVGWVSAGSSQAIGAFSAYIGADQLNITNNTSTKIAYNTEDYDVSGWYNPTLARFTPLQAGYYRFNAAYLISPAVDASRPQLQFVKNGVEWARGAMQHTGSAQGIVVAGSCQVFMNGSTDYMEAFVVHNFGVNTSDILLGDVYKFQGEFIGTA